MSISPKAAGLLKRDSVHAFKSIPKRGAETGGLLCGHIHPELQIESAVPVPIEYRFGPAYRLSDSDKAKFAAAVAANDNVIGWYRSNTRAAEGLTEEDRELARTFFPTRESAFLLCFPDSQYNVGGQLCLWTAGNQERLTPMPLGKFSLLEEALESAAREEEAAAPYVPSESARRSPSHVQPMPEPPAFAASAPPAGQPSPWMRAAGIGALALALLAGAVTFFHGSSGTSSVATVHANAIGLGMKVDRQGKALLINWDRQSAAVLEATDATFTINEGAHNKVIRLAPSELRNGGVLYTPRTASDVQVELALHGPGGNFAQSLRIVQDEKAPR